MKSLNEQKHNEICQKGHYIAMKIANKRKLIYVLPFQNHDGHDKVCLMIHMNVKRFKLVHVI